MTTAIPCLSQNSELSKIDRLFFLLLINSDVHFHNWITKCLDIIKELIINQIEVDIFKFHLAKISINKLEL